MFWQKVKKLQKVKQQHEQPPPLYSFVSSKTPMGSVARKTKGPVKEIFDEHSFEGALERIVLEFTVRRYDPAQGIRFVSSPVPQEQGFWYMPIIYAAFGKPKKIWRFTIPHTIASSSLSMTSGMFSKSQMRAEEYVDFVVAEAESLAKAYGLTVDIAYHGDPLYARKYFPQNSKTQNTG